MLVPDSSKCSNTVGWLESPATRLAGNRRSRCDPADRVETMRLPGAIRSGLATRSRRVGPRDEYVVTVSSVRSAVLRSLRAPTVITLRELQGLVMVPWPSRPEFPAAQTTTTPASHRASTACTSGSTPAGS